MLTVKSSDNNRVVSKLWENVWKMNVVMTVLASGTKLPHKHFVTITL